LTGPNDVDSEDAGQRGGSVPEEALYVRLARELRRKITSGEWPAGHTLPPERQLAEERDISRNTVTSAYDVLTNEGLITAGKTRAGRKVRRRDPLFVYASRTEDLDRLRTSSVDAWGTDVREQEREPGQDISVEVVAPAGDIATWLNVRTGDTVAVRRRLRTIDGQPDNISDTYYPMDIVNECPEILNPSDVTRGVLTLMAERGYTQVRCEDILRWGPPTPEAATKLDLGPGTAVLRQHRIGYSEDRPIRVAVTIWPGDSHELRYELSTRGAA
jgi:GntR family transcriptional regulator